MDLILNIYQGVLAHDFNAFAQCVMGCTVLGIALGIYLDLRYDIVRKLVAQEKELSSSPSIVIRNARFVRAVFAATRTRT